MLINLELPALYLQDEMETNRINLEYVSTVLQNGANIDCTDKYGQTIFHEVSLFCNQFHILNVKAGIYFIICMSYINFIFD